MTFLRHYLYKYKFTVILGCIIILLSLLPGSSLPGIPIAAWPGFDKLVHFSMYTVLSFTIFFEMRCERKCVLKFILTCMLILAFSSLLELFQKFINALERSAEILDFLANLFGILTGFFLYLIYRHIKS